jgi:glycosyltransferase involved in cell wall biosynthesis
MSFRQSADIKEKTGESGGSHKRAVLVHITTVPASLFGFLSGQLHYMSSKGFNVHVASSSGDLLDRFGEQEGITTHGINMSRRITPFADLVALFHLYSLFRRLKPTIVHAHSPKGGLLGMLAAWLCHVPVRIYHVRGFPFMTAHNLKRSILINAERVSCRLAHRVLCVSKSMKSIGIAQRICTESKSKVLLGGSGNGIDAESKFNPGNYNETSRILIRVNLNIPAEAQVIGFVGRIVRDKGICELAEAWRIIRKEFPDTHLLLVGPFELEDPILDATRLLLETDVRVHITGFVHSENLPEMFAAMNVFALPSHREGFPVVILEAGAMTLPVVASSIPGCTDAVIDNQTGLLFKEGDVNELIDKLSLYLKDGNLRALHGANARKRILTEFRCEDIWNAIRNEYCELMSTVKG